MNGSTAGQGTDWVNLAGVVNQSLLQWYGTKTGKPIASGSPPTVMRNVFGTDFGGGPTIQGQTFGSIGPLLVVAVVAVAVVLIVRR